MIILGAVENRAETWNAPIRKP